MLLWDITVARLLMGIAATSCAVFIDCGRLLLIRLSRWYICCDCRNDVFCATTWGGKCRKGEIEEENNAGGKKIDLLSYGDKQHHGIIKKFFSRSSSCENRATFSRIPWLFPAESMERVLTLVAGWLLMVMVVMVMMLLLVLNDNFTLQHWWWR